MRVMVLMGGASAERQVSMATGYGVIKVLLEFGHEVLPMDPATGRLLPLEADPAAIEQAPPERLARAPRLALAKSDAVHDVDVVFVALHGGAGEDGTMQAVLDLAGVPYTGSGVLASALAMDKARAKAVLAQEGIPVPRGVLCNSPGQARDLDPARVGGFPLVVKPNREGSSVGVHLVRTEADLSGALKDAFQYGPVLVEEFIPGRELTVAVLGGQALPVVEITPREGFYDYAHKYTPGQSDYEVPARLPEDVSRRLSEYGEAAFRALGCAGVARVDFRLDPENRPYCLELNTIPGMTATSLVPMAAQAAGISYARLVERLLTLALDGV